MKAKQLIKQLEALGITCDNMGGDLRQECSWCPKIGTVGISALDTAEGQGPLLLCTECAQVFLYQKKGQQIGKEAPAE